MIFIGWIITMLDSGHCRDSEEARPNMQQALGWSKTAWDEVSSETIKNCWNKVGILPVPVEVRSGAEYPVWNEIADFLASLGDGYDTKTFDEQPDETLTKAPLNQMRKMQS